MTFVKPGTTSLLRGAGEDIFNEQKEYAAKEVPLVKNFPRFLTAAKIDFNKKWKSNDVPYADIKDFEWFRTLGEGSFGRVLLAKHQPTSVYCAVKVLDKAKMVALRQVHYAYTEMKMLLALQFRFLVYMLYVMKDNSFLYFTMPLIVGGEMCSLLRKLRRFNDDQTKFYAAQVCLGLEYLHFLDVLHRDIKPENILIDQRGYLKIADMGFCKIVNERTYTFCGTPDYLAPEIILNKGYGKAVDWWSYGVLLYEMSTGHTPFYSHDKMKMYAKIVAGKYHNSSHSSRYLRHLISHLLQVDLTKRYGNLRNGVDDIKDHKWFRGINWLGILNYQVPAPYLPKHTRDADTVNFPTCTEKPLTVAEKDKFSFQFENF